MKGIFLLAVIAPAAMAADVYKCRGPGGETVYTSTPCSSTAEPMRLRNDRPASLTAGEVDNRRAVFRSTELSDARIAESQCVAAAVESIQVPSDRRVASLQRQIAQLNAQAGMARNNLAGATLYAGIQTQISGLQSSIATERSSTSTQMTAARARCADQRRAREDEVRERYDNTGG